MRLSVFNIYLPDTPEVGATLIYNTASGGFAEVDADTLAVLRKLDAGKELSGEEQALVDPDFLDDSVGIVVESRAAEEQDFRTRHEAWRSNADSLEAIVSVTFACNFDCTYCCQNDVLNGKQMNEATGLATAQFLATRAQEIASKEIRIAFVGGEPLLNQGRIEQIVAEVERISGIAPSFSLITNGLFLTRELVERWVKIGLKGAQITLDGDETTHSITRRSKKGEDSFATIFKNVIDVAPLIRVNVNGNYQTDTAHGFVPLIEKLREAGLAPGTPVHFSPALTALGAPSDSASGSCTWSGSSPELMLLFKDEIRKNGFDPGDGVEVGPCAFHRKHYYAVDPDGLIYKCPGFLGHEQWNIGHVTNGLSARYQGLVNINPQRECGSCAHRPHCSGGCVAAEWTRVGRAEGVNCEIGFFEKHGAELLVRKYALATSDTVEEALGKFPPALIDVPKPPVAARRGERVALRVLAA